MDHGVPCARHRTSCQPKVRGGGRAWILRIFEPRCDENFMDFHGPSVIFVGIFVGIFGDVLTFFFFFFSVGSSRVDLNSQDHSQELRNADVWEPQQLRRTYLQKGWKRFGERCKYTVSVKTPFGLFVLILLMGLQKCGMHSLDRQKGSIACCRQRWLQKGPNQ